jgi:hypothetical protein
MVVLTIWTFSAASMVVLNISAFWGVSFMVVVFKFGEQMGDTTYGHLITKEAEPLDPAFFHLQLI